MPRINRVRPSGAGRHAVSKLPETYQPAQRAGVRFGLTEKSCGSSLVTVLVSETSHELARVNAYRFAADLIEQRPAVPEVEIVEVCKSRGLPSYRVFVTVDDRDEALCVLDAVARIRPKAELVS